MPTTHRISRVQGVINPFMLSFQSFVLTSKRFLLSLYISFPTLYAFFHLGQPFPTFFNSCFCPRRGTAYIFVYRDGSGSVANVGVGGWGGGVNNVDGSLTYVWVGGWVGGGVNNVDGSLRYVGVVG